MRIFWVPMVLLSLCLVGSTQVKKSSSGTKEIQWITELDEGLKTAKSGGKPLLVGFSAEWCAPCKKMLKTTFKDGAVIEKLSQFVTVALDIDRQTDLAKKFKVEAVPTIVFLRPDGTEISRSTGYKGPKQFLQLMESALTASKKKK